MKNLEAALVEVAYKLSDLSVPYMLIGGLAVSIWGAARATKLLSDRGKDLEDARLLLRRFASTLDRSYLEPRLRELAEAFARADILEAYRRAVETD